MLEAIISSEQQRSPWGSESQRLGVFSCLESQVSDAGVLAIALGSRYHGGLPQRPSLPATRLVIQRAGAGTSDRERGPRGVGAGDDGSALRPPPTVTELGPAGRAKTNTELVSGRGVSPRSGGDPVSGSDTPPKACANCVLSVKTVHSLFFI